MDNIMNHAKTLPRADITELDTGVGLSLFYEIMKKWDIKRKEALILLGDVAPSTYNEWKKQTHPKLSHDTIVRISYIIGIVKALRLIFGNTQRADQWVNKPNKMLNGKSALDVMLQGEIVDLAFIRSIVDTARGQ
jgi:putative toxin-antitoxin system antitoxin component (TIGR02293 family)